MQFKPLVDPSFLPLMQEFQEHILAGWKIDPNNLPVDHFNYKVIHLIKEDDNDSVQEVFGYEEASKEFPELGTVVTNIEAKKLPGRPTKVK